MLPKYVWLLPLFASILLYSNDYLNGIKFNFLDKWLNIIKNVYCDLKKSNIELNKNTNQKVFTSTELKKYTNLKDGLYISILGQIFDVTKGAKHYGPGATYHVFTGRDASLAFITGEFNDKGLTDDISSLSIHQVKALNDWVQFYNKNYIYKGKLNGRYYNEDGSPTEESHNVQKILINAKEKQFEEAHKKKMFPPCNIEWKSDSGTVVWCTKKSGGIERDWIGVPRMLFESPNSKEYRCACVKLDSKEYEETKGMLREYSQCPKSSTKCAVKTEY
ncbi:neuferricin [Bombus terrestris]|uniref:Neuferricin n=1 Tax=Bombus terrestris TaxID=30195 RepID=A0A9B2JX63_BOMTE|nr:neuferricin [Bombus terrestris]XP_003394671.1 neuferricin [Bombus terrestris]XP_012176490.1 neuferricin [Bombus terrestris]XP_012176491.1 neuferricin [Bombus terrestris]